MKMRIGVLVDALVIPFGTNLVYTPVIPKDEAQTHQCRNLCRVSHMRGVAGPEIC